MKQVDLDYLTAPKKSCKCVFSCELLKGRNTKMTIKLEKVCQQKNVFPQFKISPQKWNTSHSYWDCNFESPGLQGCLTGHQDGDRGFQPQRLHVWRTILEKLPHPNGGWTLKWWVSSATHGVILLKMTSFPRCFWGYYHFRKHPNASACFCFPIFKELGTLLQCTFLLVRKVLFWHGTMKRHYWLSWGLTGFLNSRYPLWEG